MSKVKNERNKSITALIKVLLEESKLEVAMKVAELRQIPGLTKGELNVFARSFLKKGYLVENEHKALMGVLAIGVSQKILDRLVEHFIKDKYYDLAVATSLFGSSQEWIDKSVAVCVSGGWLTNAKAVASLRTVPGLTTDELNDFLELARTLPSHIT